jgi:hypothetical protein
VASKGLPWVGASGKKPSAADNYTPPGGHPGPSPVSLDGAPTHANGPIHPSLAGEQKPDMSPIGKRTYG